MLTRLLFYVLLTVHLGIIFVNNQLDAQFFFMYVYFYSLHVSGSHVPIIRRIVSVRHLVYVTVFRWPFGVQVWMRVSSKPAHQTVIYYRVTYTRCRMFISILYMFRAPMCPSSGELIVSVHESSIQTCTPNGHLYRVTYTRCRIHTINSPDDGHMAARNM